MTNETLDVVIKELDQLKRQSHHTIEEETWRIDNIIDILIKGV